MLIPRALGLPRVARVAPISHGAFIPRAGSTSGDTIGVPRASLRTPISRRTFIPRALDVPNVALAAPISRGTFVLRAERTASDSVAVARAPLGMSISRGTFVLRALGTPRAPLGTSISPGTFVLWALGTSISRGTFVLRALAISSEALALSTSRGTNLLRDAAGSRGSVRTGRTGLPDRAARGVRVAASPRRDSMSILLGQWDGRTAPSAVDLATKPERSVLSARYEPCGASSGPAEASRRPTVPVLSA